MGGASGAEIQAEQGGRGGGETVISSGMASQSLGSEDGNNGNNGINGDHGHSDSQPRQQDQHGHSDQEGRRLDVDHHPLEHYRDRNHDGEPHAHADDYNTSPQYRSGFNTDHDSYSCVIPTFPPMDDLRDLPIIAHGDRLGRLGLHYVPRDKAVFACARCCEVVVSAAFILIECEMMLGMLGADYL